MSEAENEYFITLFSNASAEFYNNKLTAFTNNLNPPLNLQPGGGWRVGLLDITHAYVFENSFDRSDDIIKFSDELNDKSIELINLPVYVMFFAKNPFVYTDSYFHDFLDMDKLKNFPNDEVFESAKTTKSFDPRVSFTLILKLKNDDKISTKITFSTKTNYTGKEILYKLLEGYMDLMNLHATTDWSWSVRELRGNQLLTVSNNFVDAMHTTVRRFQKLRKFGKSNKNNYLFLYSDVISARNVGDQFHPVLCILPIKEELQPHDYLAVKHVQYFPVKKEFIENISLKFMNEFGQPLALESSFKPTCVTLHFKKDA